MTDTTDPIPLDVLLTVAILQNPLVGSLFMGLPFGIGFFIAAYLNLIAFSQVVPPIVAALCGWLGGSITMFMMFFARPY